MLTTGQSANTLQNLYEKYRTFLAGLIAGLLAFALLPPWLYHNPDYGLDQSWVMALHLAIKNKLVFGKEFVFTYGPLGVFNTRLSIGVNEVVYILFDLFVVANFFYVFFRIIIKNNLAVSSIIIYLWIWYLVYDPSIMLMCLVL